MMKSILTKRVYASLLTSFLVVGFILTPISYTLDYKKVEAVNYDPYNTVVNTLSKASNAISAAAQKTLVAKEFSFDTLAWSMVNITLKEMIRSTTKWVNSGFKGSPAFVTDLNGFLLNTADKFAGNFIWGSELQFLCTPFALNIKLALDIQYRATRDYEAQCTLTGSIANVERFLGGDFLAGGWNSWYEITQTPGNNQYGALLVAQDRLNVGINAAQREKRDLLGFGKGFLSMERCYSTGDDERCTIETPGVVIQDQLNRSLGLPGDRLIVADELNELMGALFVQLAGQALSGAGGLLGLTEPGYGSSGNYFDRVSAERETIGYTDPTNRPIETTLQEEIAYLNIHELMLVLINDASRYKDTRYPDTVDIDGNIVSCPAPSLSASLTQQRIETERIIASTTRAVATLQVYLADYQALINALTPQAVTDDILLRYRAQTIPEAQVAVTNLYLAYVSRQGFNTAERVAEIELITLPALRNEIAAFTSQVDSICDQSN